MPPQLRSAKKSSDGKPSYDIVEWEDDPKKRKQFQQEFEKLKQYYRLLKRIAIEDCTQEYGTLKLTYNNSKDAFDQKELIQSMNEKINEIVEHESRIDGLLTSEITGSGRYTTAAPT
jgi:DNA phosphorothioation-dependent restriction protein DptG